jgi:type 1 glutamine amidotransferase
MEQSVTPGALLYVTDVSAYPATAGESEPRKGGTHHSLGSSVPALREMAERAGLSFSHFDDVRQIPLSDIELARVLALYTIGDTPWSDDQKELILQKVRAGTLGIVGLHSATDAAQSWKEYERLVGARFNGHPVTAALDIEIRDQSHSATTHLGSHWTFRDELYVFGRLRPDAHILLQVSGGNVEGLDEHERDTVFPLSWCFEEGDGHCFYTSLGHFADAFEDSRYLRHVYGGLTWVLGA